MEVTEFMDKIPLWGVFIATLMITFVSIEIGLRMGKRARGKLTREETTHTGPLIAASLSLLAFMLAIVFSVVESRFSELKHVVLDEANAIGTTYLRADLLPKTDRAVVRELLRDYVNLRIEAVQSDSDERIEQAIRRTEQIHSELWSRAVEIAAQEPTPVIALFVQSLNVLIDLHEKRITIAIRYRLPKIIWLVLCGLAIIAMAMGGYDSGFSGGRRIISITTAAAVAFSVVLLMVVALDRPHQHLSTTTQAVMLDLQEHIRNTIESQH